MIDELHGSDWVFVIDTDSYSGNFEREMCAWVTGRYGECEVGKEMAEVARKEIGEDVYEIFDELIDSVPDENGCSRPVTIWPSPDWYNDGMGNHWRRDDPNTQLHLETYIETAVSSYQPQIKLQKSLIHRLNQGEKIDGWTVEVCKEEIKKSEEYIEKVKSSTEIPYKYKAYMSVGIWLTRRPVEEEINFFKRRTATFVEAYKNYSPMAEFRKDFTLKIEGFRLIQVKRELIEEKI